MLRRKSIINLLLSLVLDLGLVFAINSTALGGNRDPVGQPICDVVAVGRSHGKILLATLAKPSEKLEWPFREIPVFPRDSRPHDVVLSAGGAKALVIFSAASSSSIRMAC